MGVSQTHFFPDGTVMRPVRCHIWLRPVTIAFTVATAAFITSGAMAATAPVSVKQTVAGYRDNAGQTRALAAFDAGGALGASGNLKLSVARERVSDRAWRDNKYLQTVYGAGTRVNDTWSLSGGRTFAKLTEARLAGGAASDGVVESRQAGIGASHWFVHETLQAGIDLSRVEVQRPEYEILDFDATVLTAPPQVDTNGATLSVRHLSTPTTMTLASATFNRSSDRPLARFYQAGVRQYVPSLRGAVHANVYRGLNRGSLSTQTLYGEVSSWSTDLAWVQELGQATQLRAGWRFHRERETGRAYGDVTQFGSDLFSVGVAHDMNPELVAGTPLTVEAGVARYLSNDNLMATTANLGVSGRL